jgi:hypothetical protein
LQWRAWRVFGRAGSGTSRTGAGRCGEQVFRQVWHV